MPVALHHVVIDAIDIMRVARFWSDALSWPILSERAREVVIGPCVDAQVGICVMPAADRKTTKNRMHLDLTCSASERDAEVDRLIGLGARRVDIGQSGEESWIVLADVEGNEFCVVRPKDSLIG